MNSKTITRFAWVGVVFFLVDLVFQFLLYKAYSWWSPDSGLPIATFSQYVSLCRTFFNFFDSAFWLCFFFLVLKMLKGRGTAQIGPVVGLISILFSTILNLVSFIILLTSIVTSTVLDGANPVVNFINVGSSVCSVLFGILFSVAIILSVIKADFTKTTKAFFIAAASCAILNNCLWVIRSVVGVEASKVISTMSTVIFFLVVVLFMIAFLFMALQGRKTPQASN